MSKYVVLHIGEELTFFNHLDQALDYAQGVTDQYITDFYRHRLPLDVDKNPQFCLMLKFMS
jgi:hypothetical protein